MCNLGGFLLFLTGIATYKVLFFFLGVSVLKLSIFTETLAHIPIIVAIC